MLVAHPTDTQTMFLVTITNFYQGFQERSDMRPILRISETHWPENVLPIEVLINFSTSASNTQ